MVCIVFFFPGIVTHYRNVGVKLDAGQVQQQLDNIVVPGIGGPGGLPGAPSFDMPPPPSFR